MQKLKEEIKRVKRHRLEYYLSHLEVVEDYIEEKPDISIETCKSIIEGISKLALHVLNQEPASPERNEDISPLCKRALKELQKGKGFSDVDLGRRISGILHYLGELRNAHGDISHGRASLQEQVHDADFADFVIGITESLGVYMLRRLDLLMEPVIEYDANIDFNEWLDQIHIMPNDISYSMALFHQEPETYEILLGDYQLEREEEDEYAD